MIKIHNPQNWFAALKWFDSEGILPTSPQCRLAKVLFGISLKCLPIFDCGIMSLRHETSIDQLHTRMIQNKWCMKVKHIYSGEASDLIKTKGFFFSNQSHNREALPLNDHKFLVFWLRSLKNGYNRHLHGKGDSRE